MFTVTIITRCGETTITEKAGLRGIRTITCIAGPEGIKMNPRPRKIEGWKTREGACQFISDSLLNDMQNGKNRCYQIITA